MATIRDVAMLAGVSVTTVSHVMNGTRVVAPDTKARVERAMEMLSFRRNALAHGLRSRHSKTIGIVVSDNSNPFFTLVVRGIEDVASANGYNIILCNSDQDLDKEARCVRLLVERQVDGLIISSARRTAPHLSHLVQIGIPIVFVNRYAEDIPADVVLTNNTKGAYDAVMHLVSNGYRRIATVTGPLDIVTGRHRYDGYLNALSEVGYPLDMRLVRHTDFTKEAGYRATMELLDLADPPDALFVPNYYMTVGALAAIKERKVDIPDQLGIIGFDDTDWAGLVTPTLTTVAQPTYEIGSTAASLLLERLSPGPSVVPPNTGRITYLPARLIVRESSVPVRPEAAQEPGEVPA